MRGKMLETNFVVMRGRHQNLIGRSTAVTLGMVKLNLGPEPNPRQKIKILDGKSCSNTSKDEFEAMFPKLFSVTMGCLNDMEVKLEVDE